MVAVLRQITVNGIIDGQVPSASASNGKGVCCIE